jgi:protein ImuB
MLPRQQRECRGHWLGIAFPHLALDLLTRGQNGRECAIAVSDTIKRRDVIIDCNPAALAGGIKTGMPVSAALSVLGELRIFGREPEAERRALQRLAAWCYQYSSQVCLPDGRNGLFIEVGGSKRLFGAPETLGRRLEREMVRLGYHAMAGSAPTPEAAWLASRESLHIDSPGRLRRQLGPLPLHRLFIDEMQQGAMERMGFRQLRDLLRLPRRSLTRRFGPQLNDYLDRLLGISPDPRVLYHPPETFSSQLELTSEIHNCQALLFPSRRLLDELCGVLRGGDRAVQSLRIVLKHEDAGDSLLQLGLQSPTQDSSRLMTLLRERLERLRLPQPVRGIRLEAPQLLKFQPGQSSLFHDTPLEYRQSIEQLAERLQARLGGKAISGLAGVQDHRPEYSWRLRALDEHTDCIALAHRPAWLMPRPRPCMIEDYEIIAGPERIESGWWDGRDCRRDYFIVRDVHGSTLWAFHEYKPRRGWYLHGIFA